MNMSDDDTDDDEANLQEEKKKKKKKKKPPKELYKNIKCEKAFYFLRKENPIRRFCGRVVEAKYFETIILGMIVLNSIKLAYDTYIPVDP